MNPILTICHEYTALHEYTYKIFWSNASDVSCDFYKRDKKEGNSFGQMTLTSSVILTNMTRNKENKSIII